MIKELKANLHKEIKDFMLEKLFNHRKKKEGLISIQNQLIDDINRFLTDWEKTEESYLSMQIRTKGFIQKPNKEVSSHSSHD